MEPFWIQGRLKHGPLERHFGQKGAKSSTRQAAPALLEPTRARNGAENAPKRPEDRILLILEGFATNLGSVFHDFLVTFNMFLYQFRCMFEQIRINIFTISFQQLEQLRTTYLKVLGAIDALQQIEEANAEPDPETEEEESEEE